MKSIELSGFGTVVSIEDFEVDFSVEIEGKSLMLLLIQGNMDETFSQIFKFVSVVQLFGSWERKPIRKKWSPIIFTIGAPISPERNPLN